MVVSAFQPPRARRRMQIWAGFGWSPRRRARDHSGITAWGHNNPSGCSCAPAPPRFGFWLADRRVDTPSRAVAPSCPPFPCNPHAHRKFQSFYPLFLRIILRGFFIMTFHALDFPFCCSSSPPWLLAPGSSCSKGTLCPNFNIIFQLK